MYVKQTAWDLAIIDEAHRLRNVYKSSNKIAKEIKGALLDVPKILLTATPLQNSLLELYGLVSIIDEHIFGDVHSFKSNYSRVSSVHEKGEDEIENLEPQQEMFLDLRERLKPVCIRTLRSQVLEYIKYTKRIPITQEYTPTEDEIELYNSMTEYLQRPTLYALPSSQRHLMTLILRKLLSSSSFAIASTLDGLALKLENFIKEVRSKSVQNEIDVSDIGNDFERSEELEEEWNEDGEKEKPKEIQLTENDIPAIEKEKEDLEKFRDLAKKIWKNSKGDALITGLQKGFEMTEELHANKKAIIFTESRITQEFLMKLLTENGYKDKVVFFNGANNDVKSKEIYTAWIEKYKNTDKVTGSKSADMRAAIVEYFKNEAEIMIATEAGAEGINLQFCSLIINYDLPWNPQRVEQRIGRCHRYGQKHDVVVVNFVNLKNAADKRIYELLDQKFNLFKGVFGASDEVLGAIESGVDFEKRIAGIFQTCRTEDEINTAFDDLQKEMDTTIQVNVQNAKQKLLENFDADVHDKLKMNLTESQQYLDRYEKWLWETTKHFLGDLGIFEENAYSFTLNENPFIGEIIPAGPYKIGKQIEDAHIYRPGHPLAEKILLKVKSQQLPVKEIVFDYSNNPTIVSAVKDYVGKSGWISGKSISISTFEVEDHILLSGMTERGDLLDGEQCRKLFSLGGSTREYSEDIEQVKVEALNKQLLGQKQDILDAIGLKNASFFEQELDKLDKWGEDQRSSLKLHLKELDSKIKDIKKQSRLAPNLPEKLKLEKERKNLESDRDLAWKSFDGAAKEIEKNKDALIDSVELRLNEDVTEEEIFLIHWKVI